MIDLSDKHAVPPSASDAITPEVWRKLYALARAVRALEPWKWMEETDIFGVEDPDSGELVFVSVMGLLGRHHAVAVYPGAKALSQFWEMQQAPDGEPVADIMCQTHNAQAEFGAKKDLNATERQWVKTLGLTFKGAHAWPCFRSYRPGWFPWTADAREARWIALALEQLLDVAPRIQKDRRLLGTGGADRRYLIRKRSDGNPPGPWRDTHESCPPPAEGIRINVPTALLRDFRALPSSEMIVEMDVYPSFMAVGDRGKRPQMPWMLMACEPDSGLILGFDLLTIEGEIQDLWAQTPEKFLKMLVGRRIRPALLRLRTPWVAMVMDALCQELGIAMEFVDDLPAVAEARREMERFNR